MQSTLMEEKWKLSKRESSSSSSSSSITRSFSTKSGSCTSSKAPPLLKKSSSLKIFSSSPPKPPLPRSSSLKASPPKISPSFSWRFSQKARKCTSMAKEQKARFYIMRRCVAMLICWHKHGD